MAQTNVKTNGKKKVTKNYKGKAKDVRKISALNGSKAGMIEYRMGKEMMNDILQHRKEHGTSEEKKMDVQDYLCHYVNEQYGLMGNCVKVSWF